METQDVKQTVQAIIKVVYHDKKMDSDKLDELFCNLTYQLGLPMPVGMPGKYQENNALNYAANLTRFLSHY
jgi:hypothetical protein